MKRARDALFARARFSLDEDEGIGRSDAGDDLAQLDQRGALADQISRLRQRRWAASRRSRWRRA